MNESTLPVPDPSGLQNDRSFWGRLKFAWYLEFSNFRWPFFACAILSRALPVGRALEVRTKIMRMVGFEIGARTKFLGVPKFTSSPGPLGHRLRFGSDCTIGKRVIVEFAERITVGDRVTLADGVVILTTTHQLGPKEHRAGSVVMHPVVVGNDVEIGADVVILPGSTIGDGARVLPNSVVNASVAAGTTVSGIPARPARRAV